MIACLVRPSTRARLTSPVEAEKLDILRRRAKASMPIGTFLTDRFAGRLPGTKRRPMAGYAR